LKALAEQNVLKNEKLKDDIDGKEYSVYRRTNLLGEICPEISATPDKRNDINIILKNIKNKNRNKSRLE
jgi:hypothetical protein